MTKLFQSLTCLKTALISLGTNNPNIGEIVMQTTKSVKFPHKWDKAGFAADG
jgi:hypothetical protein